MAANRKNRKTIKSQPFAEKSQHAEPAKKAIREVHLLEQGFQPEKNKIGTEFKGKNRVIIA